MADIDSIVVVRFDEQGEMHYTVIGDERVRLFIVDDRCPNDRVYEWLERAPKSAFREIVGEDETIGSRDDARHEAIAAKIRAARDGRPHLEPVA